MIENRQSSVLSFHIFFDREFHLVHGVAGFYLFKNPGGPFREFRGPVEAFFNGAKKTVIV